MQRVAVLSLAAVVCVRGVLLMAEKSTSLADARNAIEANLKTTEGKAFDTKIGEEFARNGIANLRPCNEKAGGDSRSFWILLRVDKDGRVEEALSEPETKMWPCVRDVMLQTKFPAPPKPAYWIGIYLKLSH